MKPPIAPLRKEGLYGGQSPNILSERLAVGIM